MAKPQSAVSASSGYISLPVIISHCSPYKGASSSAVLMYGMLVCAVSGGAQQGAGGDHPLPGLPPGPGRGLPLRPHHLSQAGRGRAAHQEPFLVPDHVPQGMHCL